MTLDNNTQTVDIALADALGISALEEGFACVRVAPVPGDRAEARGTIAIPTGKVVVEWHNADDRFTLEVSVPIGTHLQVALPAGMHDSLLVDGEPVASDSQIARTQSTVDLAVLPGTYYHFEVLKNLG
jgi:hypothetical protein